MGPHCLIVAQVGIAGSATLGHHCTLGGQVGVVGHITIGNNVTIGAQAGVINSIPDGETVAGAPAIDVNQARRAYTMIPYLPQMRQDIRSLQSQLEKLRRRHGIAAGQDHDGVPPAESATGCRVNTLRCNPAIAEPDVIGLIAGGGRLPFLVAAGARRHGLRVVCVGLAGYVDEPLAGEVDAFYPVAVARPGSWMRKLRKHGVTQVVMVGRVTKSHLFTPWRILQYLPDWRAFRIYYWRLRGKSKQTDTLLSALADELASRRHHSGEFDDVLPGIPCRGRRHDAAEARARRSSTTSSSAGRWPRSSASSTSARPSRSRSGK